MRFWWKVHADIFLFFVQILKFFVQNFQKHADVFSDFRQYIGKDFTVAEEDISYAWIVSIGEVSKDSKEE